MTRCLNPRCQTDCPPGSVQCTNPFCQCLLPQAVVAGRYRIETLVGIGGMGAVYRVSDTFDMQQVALKVLSLVSQQMDEETAMERFRREARYAHQLHHKNIVPVINFGRDGSMLYLVMPLITGGTVKALLKGEHPLPVAQARQYLNDLADALDAIHAHPQQIVHRDIKPSNLLIHQDDGRLMVTDFGIARAMQQEKALTQRGWSLGTEHYIAPEQEQGKAEPASDIYAMGVVAYQMLTGLLPFQAVVKSHATELPLPSTLNTWLPSTVDAVVLRAIEIDPHQRYASARAFANALNDALTSEASPDASAPTISAMVVAPDNANVIIRTLMPENPCANCGRENRGSSRFCRHCGHSLDETSPLVTEVCQFGYYTDIGRYAQENEDMLLLAQGLCVNLAPPPRAFGLFAVADGLRGLPDAQTGKPMHVKGHEASRLGVETIADTLLPLLTTSSRSSSRVTPGNSSTPAGKSPAISRAVQPTHSSDTMLEQWLRDGVRQANQVIYHCNADYDTAMGSTLTVALLYQHRLYVANVGDSRAYHYSTSKGLERITSDHALTANSAEAQLLQQDKRQKSAKPDQDYRYLGRTNQVQADLFQCQVEPGDLLLLCTDGLWHMVHDERIARLLARGGDPEQIARTLVEMANKAGGEGNASAIVVRVL